MAESTMWFVWVFGFLLPPFLALFYSVSVLAIFIFFHEWTIAEKLPSLVWRLALMGGASAIVYSDRVATELGSDLTDLSRVLMMAIQASLVWILSIYFIVETRLEDVVGSANPSRKVDNDALKGKVVLITGANAGIGKETARQVAELGAAKVILACRSSQRGLQAIDDLIKQQEQHSTKAINPGSAYTVLKCDLGSFQSIRQAVGELKVRKSKDIPQIDYLILNAGVMMNDKVMTKDGCETMMQANLLGHFLMFQLLLKEKLLKPNDKNPPRVLHLSSTTFQLAIDSPVGGMDLDDMFCTKGKRKYTLFGQYAQSKLGNILIARESARRYSGKLISLAIHPGIVRTDVTRNMPYYLYYPNLWLGSFVQTLQKTVAQGAWCTIAGVLLDVDANQVCSEETDAKDYTSTKESDAVTIIKSIPNGAYLQNGKVRLLHPYTYEEADARKLWDMSEKLVGLEQK